jgi:multidrug resistance protein MdtO
MPVSIAHHLSELIRLLAPQPGRVAFALRVALICALAALVAEIYQTPDPALSTYIVFFLNREDRAASIVLNVVILLVMTVTIGFVIVVAMIVADDPMWRVASMTLISFCLLFLASASKLRPIGSTVALIVGYALDKLGNVQVGELATRGYLYAWLFVGIPVGVSMVVNLLLAPPPRRLAERAIARRLILAAAMLRMPDERTRQRFHECLQEGSTQIHEWVGLAQREKSAPATDLIALQQAAESTLRVLSAIDVADRIPEALLPSPLREYIAKTLEQMAGILVTGRYPVDTMWQPPHDEPLPFSLAEEIRAEIRDAIIHFTTPPTISAPPPEGRKEARGFFVEDAFTNPEHVHYAIKTTAAAMFCYMLYSLLDWPGIHTIFLTCYIVSLGTVAETVEKLTLRILGCLIGAAVGIGAIVFVMPSLTSIEDLMAIVFIGALVPAYIAVGSPRISYAGFQIAFAFFLCVLQGSAPAFDMTVARDRIIGILLGNLVVYVLFTNLWPISVAKNIDPGIAALLQSLGAMMREVSPWARRALASKALSALSALKTDIDRASYEPQAVRTSNAWLESREGTVRGIGTLYSPLLLSAEQDGEKSTHIATRLEALAGRFASTDAQPALPGESPPLVWSEQPLFHIIDTGLRGLEHTPN